MITNLVMLWYCSVSTESTFLFVVGTGIVATEKDLMVVCICSYRWSLSDLHRTRLSSTLEGNCPIPHTAKGPEASQTKFTEGLCDCGECSVKTCTVCYCFMVKL